MGRFARTQTYRNFKVSAFLRSSQARVGKFMNFHLKVSEYQRFVVTELSFGTNSGFLDLPGEI